LLDKEVVDGKELDELVKQTKHQGHTAWESGLSQKSTVALRSNVEDSKT